ncbi:RraA family protein [Jatrophihabitans sp. DSM 45814]
MCTPSNEAEFNTSAVSDALDETGRPGAVLDGLVRVVPTAAIVVGRARTATVVPGTGPGIVGLADFVADTQVGDVMVLGWAASGPISTWGGIAAQRARANGVLGLVTDGWVRDVEEIDRHDFVVYAAGTTPRSGKGRIAITRIGEPTTVGGVLVEQGDTVVADASGVCVLAASASDAVLARARELHTINDVLPSSHPPEEQQ